MGGGAWQGKSMGLPRVGCHRATSLSLSPCPWAFRATHLVKDLPGMQETPVLFLGQEDPLEKG